MFIWIASSDYETISIYINFFQICNRASLSSTRTSYINVWNNKHWNVSERSNFCYFQSMLYEKQLALLRGYPTPLDVSDILFYYLFYFHFAFTWSRAMTRLLTEIQFYQPGETVMRMLMYQFKLTKSQICFHQVAMNMCLVWWDGTDFISTQKYIILVTEPARLSGYFFHIKTQLENNTSP